MASASKQVHYTSTEYLAKERAAEFKSEYHDCQIYAMSGASRPHNLVVVNLARELSIRFRDRPCELYVADMRVLAEEADSYYYPDVVVVCGEPRLLDNHFDTLLNPDLIIEVLSPSTETYDRGGKFTNYRRLESLQDYVLVSQDKIYVERYSRQGGEWHCTEWTHLDDILSLPSIGCDVPLREIYAKVSFPGGDPILGV